MAKMRIGVFGGFRGRRMVSQVAGSTEAELVAVCDRSTAAIETCRKLAEEAGMDHVAYYSDFDEFFKHDMDAVILANYANEHVSYAIRFLESGRHVMSEVMTCVNMKEAVELIEAVERTGKLYTYAECYCYTPVRWEMRERYLRGDIGELMYAEGEYIHDCSSVWPMITYGERNHWRNQMASTFYCTHSIGPILTMTGLRPVQVSGFETKSMPFTRKVGYPGGTFGMEILTLNNGAVVKSTHFNLKHTTEVSNYQLNGDRGAMKDLGDGSLALYMEGPNENGRGKHEILTPNHLIEEAKYTVHGGGDYYTTYYFIRALLGDEAARERVIDVYQAVDMCIPGILGYRSIVNGNAPVKVPDLRIKAEREPYRDDRFCTFPENAGDQWVSNNNWGDPEIPDSVYEEVKRKWLAGEEG